MTLKQQERLRLILFIAAYGSSIISRMSGNDINNFLSSYNLSLEEIRKNLFILEDLAIVGAGWMEFVAKEHKEIKTNYEEIIHSAGDLFKTVEVSNNPVKSFALYVYLYRNGYLSCNHKFCYSFSCKDFARLTGADVITGKAVCRGISSMFTDICKENGMDASNVPVKVNPKRFNGLQELCPTDLRSENVNSFEEIFSKISPYIPLGNHVTTHLAHNGIKYDFDPTNDIFLTEKNGRLYISDSSKYYISHDRIFGFIPLLLGQFNFDIRCGLGIKDTNLPTITHDEYVKLYQEALKMIKDNLDVFEKFYQENNDRYQEIASTANKQHSLIKRYMPILPIE